MEPSNATTSENKNSSQGTSKDNVSEPNYFHGNTLLEIDKVFYCDYRDDIWRNLLEQEADKMIIHLQSPQLQYRGALVTQLRQVCKALQMDIGILHAAVSLLDLFMDAHTLRSDRLSDCALACLSLAAKSEEKFSLAPTLKTLSKVSEIHLCGKLFRQLEWMIGQHVKWRLLSPTPATYAALLAQFVITEDDLVTRHPKYMRRLKKEGQKLLEAYLDLTLSDFRLCRMESSRVACACVAAARATMGAAAWPPLLARRTQHSALSLAPTARLLLRMMQVVKSREKASEDVDQGYGSGKSSPIQTPYTSPQRSSSPNNLDSKQKDKDCNVLDFNDSNISTNNTYNIAIDTRPNQIIKSDYNFYKSQKLIDALSSNNVRMSVKRTSVDAFLDSERKRVCLIDRMSQVNLNTI